MSDPDREHDQAAASRHIELARVRVERQRELVRELERDGHDTTAARLLLDTMQGVLHTLEAHRETMRALMTRAGDALRRSQEELHTLFELAPDGIFVANLDGRYTDVNAAGCQLLGYSRDEIIGKTIIDLIPPGQEQRLWRSREAMLHGRPDVEEWALRRKDGSYLPAEVSAKILSDGRWIGFVRDISERKRALDVTRAAAEELERRVAERTAQLRELAAALEAAEDRERRQIARDLHDDLAQTLAAVRIRLADLSRDVHEPACIDAAREIDRLIAEADRATRSLAAQLAPAVLYELGLVPALEWLAEEIERTHGLRVHVRDDGADKPLSQEARSIVYRAVRELLINVSKHAAVDVATVESERSGERLIVRVSDAGVGFAPAVVAAPLRGRGLGLVSIHERLGFIGGTAQVQSIPGDGTVATLCVPLAAEPAMAEDEA